MTVKERFIRIQELLLDIQMNTEYSVHVWFSGHVNSMDIQIMVSKSDYHSEFVEIKDIRFNEWFGRDPVVKMNKTIEVLEGVLNGTIKPICQVEELVKEVVKPVYRKMVI